MPERIRALLERRSTRARLPAPVQRIWQRTLDRLAPLGGSSDGNQITLFFEGDDVYDAMLAAIAAAHTRVWLETYIIEPDRVGMAFLSALLDAKRRGVDVLFMFDPIGSPKITEEHLKPLHEAGARVVPFNPPGFIVRRRLPVLHRDHRKILIVDEVGFCGGMNISEDYAGAKWGNGLFRDTHALIEGPAVRDLANVLMSSLATATGVRLALPPARAPQQRGLFMQVLGSDVPRRKRHIQRALYQTVGRCVRSCHLTSPYFVPPPRLLNALVRAARRGVDVRVLTAGLSDVPIVAIAARHLYGRLLRGGVKVFEMTKRTLHSKTATIDGVYASVGSFNLDRWSFARNLEVNVAIVDGDVALSLEAQFERDLALSREVKLEEHEARSFIDRVVGWVAYQLMRL